MFTENQKRFILIFFFSVLFMAVLVTLVNPQNYTITEQELQSIEKISQTYEMEKLHWLEQAQNLNMKVETLNSQLKNQEVLQKKSEQYFNEYEKEKTEQINKLQTDNIIREKEISSLREELQKQKKNVWIVIAVCIVGWLAFILTTFLLIKSKV